MGILRRGDAVGVEVVARGHHKCGAQGGSRDPHLPGDGALRRDAATSPVAEDEERRPSGHHGERVGVVMWRRGAGTRTDQEHEQEHEQEHGQERGETGGNGAGAHPG